MLRFPYMASHYILIYRKMLQEQLHDFLVRHSGKRWDYDFIKNLDSNEKTYYLYKFRNELAQENAERLGQGLSVLSEKDGTPVEFPQNYY